MSTSRSRWPTGPRCSCTVTSCSAAAPASLPATVSCSRRGIWAAPRSTEKQLAVGRERRLVERDQPYELELVGVLTDGCDRDLGRGAPRVAEDAGRDRGEGDRRDTYRARDFDRSPVARGELRRFAAITSVPHRTNGVHDPRGPEPEAGRDHRVAGRAR